MKKLLIAIACAVVGCASSPSSEEKVVFQVSTDNFDWVLGQWDCVGHYHDVPPFSARTETSSYSFSLDASGRLIGSYRPIPVGNSNLPGSDEMWTPLGDGIGMAIELAYTDGALRTSGSGSSRADLDAVTLGLADFTAASNKGVWHHSVTMTDTDAVVVLSMDSYLGVFQNLYLNSSCTSRP